MKFNHESPEITEQLQKLFQLIQAEQQKISAIKGPNVGHEQLIASTLQFYTKNRGRKPLYNFISSGRGSGPFTELIDGSVKYDLIGGIGVGLLGHAHPIMIKAHLEAALVDTVMCANLQPYKEPIELTETLLSAVATSSLRHFWFTGSGSCANDTALKLIWQKKAPNYRLIAFEKCFTGRTVATEDITHNRSYKEGMPDFLSVDHVPHFDQKNPEGALQKTMDALNALYEEHGESYAAITLELLQGEGGFIYGTSEYYKTIFKWAKERGLYIWIDEVQTFARTRELFAFQHFELDEYVDIVTVGKALQCCGVLFSEELNPKPGLIAGTFNAAVSSMKAGTMTIKHLLDGGYYGANGTMKKIEESMIHRLKWLSQNKCKGKIGHIGGIGTMIAFELGDGSKELTDRFLNKLLENGVLAFSAGKDPTRVRFLLPIVLTEVHLDEIFQIIEKTILECC